MIEERNWQTSSASMALRQGNLDLLESDIARRLLASRIPGALRLGDEAARAYLGEIDQAGTRMARIDLQPTWVGVLDFQTRLPSALGGIS